MGVHHMLQFLAALDNMPKSVGPETAAASFALAATLCRPSNAAATANAAKSFCLQYD
jgi:hypothetical protein